MRLHRFLGNFNLNLDFLKISEKEIVHQIKNVLKLKKGEKIILIDGKENEALSKIWEIKKDWLKVKILEKRKSKAEPKIFITLFCSNLKKKNFELIVQKATEIGVRKIFPIISERTVKLKIKPERISKIIKEATEQAERGILPELGKILKFEEAIREAKQNDLNLFLDRRGKFIKSLKLKPKRIGVFVGPEGGWGERELKLAKKEKFKILKISDLNLRSETAAILGVFLALFLFNH